MQKRLIWASAAALVVLAGCEKAEAPAPAEPTTTEVPVEAAPSEGADAAGPAAASHRYAAWAGKWTGVEGMYATITTAEPGKYKLEMQSDLDTKGTYDGSDGDGGITFTRGGETLTLTASTGDATGLKYLAGKKDCLKVKDGEGYCRD
ncbi:MULTISPECIES: hypothetical protein [unclassified Sphingopyxis]|uniref:hypothetical protein n=1 Tax=unclassified Sphingopyxis TaxID=2614943 RepID=UPI00285F5228|nr:MULTISPECIES: hypothetical protein [unclassified Sphingopyxis]MDR6831767.1 hypothetical protein [Sphingopyxis sp. BE122]MDR7227509.1 hypothetical protein [Sphingopyxis sp. BE259]